MERAKYSKLIIVPYINCIHLSKETSARQERVNTVNKEFMLAFEQNITGHVLVLTEIHACRGYLPQILSLV